jgi:hypothetical protein
MDRWNDQGDQVGLDQSLPTCCLPTRLMDHRCSLASAQAQAAESRRCRATVGAHGDAVQGDEASLPDLAVKTTYQYFEEIPVFFGHYWLRGMPAIAGEYAACLDFSVAKQGFLAAYRWSGERVLSPGNIVYVSAVQ